jgi:hypothetical protein
MTSRWFLVVVPVKMASTLSKRTALELQPAARPPSMTTAAPRARLRSKSPRNLNRIAKTRAHPILTTHD